MAGNKGKVNVINNNGGPVGFVFFLTYIGAAIYFIQQNDGFWGVVLGLLEAAVWPVFVIYKVLGLLNIG